MPDVLPITAIVHTKNSAETLARCLQSLPPVAELLVVDMKSTDDSLRIAKQFNAKILSVDDVGFTDPARNIAFAAATQPWLLLVDADEALPPETSQWLPDLLANTEKSIYALPRINYFFGKQLKHTGWWPDYQVRLFRAGTVQWPAKIHTQPTMSEQPHKLPASDAYALSHLNYQHIDQFIDRMNRYTTIEAMSGEHVSSDDQWLLLQMREFLSRLGAHEGWRDKEHGLAASLLQSFYPLVSSLKRWEAAGFSSSPTFDESLEKQLDSAVKELGYWRASIRIQKSSGFSRLLWRVRRKLQV